MREVYWIGDRLLLVECMELEEVFMWLYDLSNDRGTYNAHDMRNT